MDIEESKCKKFLITEEIQVTNDTISTIYKNQEVWKCLSSDYLVYLEQNGKNPYFNKNRLGTVAVLRKNKGDLEEDFKELSDQFKKVRLIELINKISTKTKINFISDVPRNFEFNDKE